MDGVAYLIQETFTQNDYGQQISQKTKSKIFVSVDSISRSEWDSAGRQGLNPEYKLITPKCNYNGENLIEMNDSIYRIYRTFVIDEDIELYIEKRAGTCE